MLNWEFMICLAVALLSFRRILIIIPSSPVDFKSNPEMSCLNRQDKPLDRKFSVLYDGISCQFVGVEQFSQSKKL